MDGVPAPRTAAGPVQPVDLDQFIAAVREIDEFFVQVVRLPGR